GAEESAGGLYPVAQVESMQKREERVVAHLVLAKIELNGAESVAQLNENGLAHVPNRGDPTTDRDVVFRRSFAFVRLEQVDRLRRRVRAARSCWIRFHTVSAELMHLVQPDALQL